MIEEAAAQYFVTLLSKTLKIMTTNKGEVRRLEGSRDWTSELSVHRADDRVVRLQQVKTILMMMMMI